MGLLFTERILDKEHLLDIYNILVLQSIMKIKYHKHKNRHARAESEWIKMAEAYNSGEDIKSILARHINPITKKPYTRAHLYWVLKHVSKI